MPMEQGLFVSKKALRIHWEWLNTVGFKAGKAAALRIWSHLQAD
jgi:hypothetical protein